MSFLHKTAYQVKLFEEVNEKIFFSFINDFNKYIFFKLRCKKEKKSSKCRVRENCASALSNNF